MDQRVLSWLKNNIGKTFESPRKEVFKIYPSPIKIVAADENKKRVEFDFVEKQTKALPLHFWMFDRTLPYLRTNKEKFIWLGARVQPPYDDDTVEGQIWKEPYPYSSPYKISPHICDVLVLVGVAEYGYTNSTKGRSVQGVKYTDVQSGIPLPTPKPLPEPLSKNIDLEINDNERTDFIKTYKRTIIKWTEENELEIVRNRSMYSWGNKSTLKCVRERNDISRAIILSRIKNGGGVDLDTLDKVTQWGFGRNFPLRDNEKALQITQKAFNNLDEGNLKKATKILLNIKGVGISRASKILGLFDQENLCIYDSRVGHALKNLVYENKKIILCPPGRNRKGDTVTKADVWAEQYQGLVWALEIVRDYLNEKVYTFRLDDIEMALFMMGK